VTLGIARQFLREGNQFPAAERCIAPELLGHLIMIARSRAVGNLNGRGSNPAKAGSHIVW